MPSGGISSIGSPAKTLDVTGRELATRMAEKTQKLSKMLDGMQNLRGGVLKLSLRGVILSKI